MIDAGVRAAVRVDTVVFRHVRTFLGMVLSLRHEGLVHIAVRALFDRTVGFLGDVSVTEGFPALVGALDRI
jgi:hypothetical protein